MKLYKFNLVGLHCEACCKIVTKRIAKINGVTDIKIDLTGNLAIESDLDLDKNIVSNALKDTDYKIL